MKTANTHSTATPVASAKGLTANTPPQSNERCLINSTTLLDTIAQAKSERDIEGRGNAYVRLLAHFHRAIIPGFLIEAGSISEASKLLGIHRETLTKYIDIAGIDVAAISAGGVA